jgi:GrpB-like predicted nucleotidyltransferase (UPF0157 family)
MIPDKNQKRTYSIEHYDPEWIAKFGDVKKMLEDVFGSKALSIEHVGSTSIPGMKAKPIIDALVIVEKMEPFITEKGLMVQKGYEWGENYIAPDTLIFYKTDGDRKTENIHVCVKGSFKATQFIVMRDYLRSHPDKAKEYSDIKEKLKKQFPDDYPAYRAGKHDLLEEIEKLARVWKLKI